MLSPDQVAFKYPDIAAHKAETPAFQLFVKGMMAGAFVAGAVFAAHMVSVLVPDAGVAKLIAALLFPGGLAMVVFCGAELFTSNCLMPLGVFSGRVTLTKMLRNWAFVYFGNFAGALCVAGLTVAARQADPAFVSVAVHAAEAKAALTFGETLARGVLCNIFVCSAMWMTFSTDSTAGKIIAMYFPVMFFVLCGTEHCVANMYYFSSAMFLGGSEMLTLPKFLLENLIPATLGNILGGSVLISGALWVALGKGKK